MNDIKCTHHPQHDIIYVCKSCSNYKPACRKCITSIHQDHSFLDIEDLGDSIKNGIRSHYYNNTLPQLDTILDNCKSKLAESDNHYKQIEQDHDINFTTLESTFKSIKDIINAKEYDLKRQLLTKLDENKDINTINSTLCNNIITTINNIKDENNNSNKNINNINININQNQLIELVKRNDQCNTFSSSITTTNNSNNNINNNINNKLQQYKDTTMIVSEHSINTIKDKINMMIQISDKPNKPNKPLKVENGYYSYKQSWNFKVYQDGMNISTINHHCLAIDYGHHLPPVFPQYVTRLLLPDDFDQPLNSLPSHIDTLYLCNIKLQLTEASIPNSILYIFFSDGFSQRLSKEIFGRSIEQIVLGDTLYPLEENVNELLPNIKIYLMKSHKHQVPTVFNGRTQLLSY